MAHSRPKVLEQVSACSKVPYRICAVSALLLFVRGISDLSYSDCGLALWPGHGTISIHKGAGPSVGSLLGIPILGFLGDLLLQEQLVVQQMVHVLQNFG